MIRKWSRWPVSWTPLAPAGRRSPPTCRPIGQRYRKPLASWSKTRRRPAWCIAERSTTPIRRSPPCAARSRMPTALAALEPQLGGLADVIATKDAKTAMATIKTAESAVGKVTEAGKLRAALSKVRRALRGKNPDPAKAQKQLIKALSLVRRRGRLAPRRRRRLAGRRAGAGRRHGRHHRPADAS